MHPHQHIKNVLVYGLPKSPDTNINIFYVGVRNVGVSVVIGWCGILNVLVSDGS